MLLYPSLLYCCYNYYDKADQFLVDSRNNFALHFEFRYLLGTVVIVSGSTDRVGTVV